MVTNERLIKISVPDFNEIITGEANPDAFCLCYQFDINSEGYGRYGFETEKAKRLINELFPCVYYYDERACSLVKKSSFESPGVYFF